VTVEDKDGQIFKVTDDRDREQLVDMVEGLCTCHYFVQQMIPCIHMYAVLHFVKPYGFSSLPHRLLNARHMMIDVTDLVPSTANEIDVDDLDVDFDADYDVTIDDLAEDTIPGVTTDRTDYKRIQQQMVNVIKELENMTYALAVAENEEQWVALSEIIPHPLEKLQVVAQEIRGTFPQQGGLPIFDIASSYRLRRRPTKQRGHRARNEETATILRRSQRIAKRESMIHNADPDGLWIGCGDGGDGADGICDDAVPEMETTDNVRSSKRTIKPSQRMVDSQQYEKYRNKRFVYANEVDSGSESESE